MVRSKFEGLVRLRQQGAKKSSQLHRAEEGKDLRLWGSEEEEK